MRDFWKFFKQNKAAVFGLYLILFFIVLSFLAPLVSPHDPTELYRGALKLSPGSEVDGASFLLGTDDVGRDLLSRLIYGARISMMIGLFVVLFSASIGTTLGLIAGYVGGVVETVIMRTIDMMMSVPSTLLAIVIVSILGPSLANTIIAVGVVSIPNYVRIVRASVLGEKNKQYVQACKSYGSGMFRVLFINILPNCLGPLIVQASLSFSNAILDAAALGFLGLGAQPPTPEWGTMLADGREFIESAPWLVTLPGVCILLAVLGFNLLGDGLRDAFDPKLKKI